MLFIWLADSSEMLVAADDVFEGAELADDVA